MPMQPRASTVGKTKDTLELLTEGVPLPRLVKIKQKFDAPRILDVASVLRDEFAKPGVGDRIKPGMKIAIAVGSRGLAELVPITRASVEEVKCRGGEPFIVPGMGSHGGATAEGQKQLLAGLNITEETVGCPIRSCMDVVEVGRLNNGLAVLMDKLAYEADGIIPINRVKTHTAFHGEVESGIAKMLAIGLGKQKGADSCHLLGFGRMCEMVKLMAPMKIERTPVLFGIATVENAYDQVMLVEAIPAKDIMQRDAELLITSKKNMPRIMFDPMDVLIVQQMGKEISGSGMDPNITGRYPTPYCSGGPKINKLVILDLTEGTHGNANGMGQADFSTFRLFSKIDNIPTYANALTTTITTSTKMPLMMRTDEEAIKAAVKTCNNPNLADVRLVYIKDTMHLGEFYISEALLEEARRMPNNIEIIGQAEEMKFDSDGNLIPLESYKK